jgi:hypothetical protein
MCDKLQTFYPEVEIEVLKNELLDFVRKWKSLSLALPNPTDDDEDITTINAESNEDEYNSRGQQTCRNCILC